MAAVHAVPAFMVTNGDGLNDGMNFGRLPLLEFAHVPTVEDVARILHWSFGLTAFTLYHNNGLPLVVPSANDPVNEKDGVILTNMDEETLRTLWEVNHSDTPFPDTAFKAGYDAGNTYTTTALARRLYTSTHPELTHDGSDDDDATEPMVFIDAVPDARDVRSYLVLQKMETCYIAAVLNVLFSVPALRHFMVALLNAELTAADDRDGGAARLLEHLKGPFRVEALRTAMLRLVVHHLCGDRALNEPVTHILEIILRPDAAAKLAESESPGGGKSYLVLGAMLLALGVPDNSVLVTSRRKLWTRTVADATRLYKHDTPIMPRDTIDGKAYSVEALLANYEVVYFPGRRRPASTPALYHEVTGVINPVTGSRAMFNPWGCMYDVDWLQKSILSLKGKDGHKLRCSSKHASDRHLYVLVSEDFKRRHARPPKMRPACLLDFTEGPLPLTSLEELGANAGHNVPAGWVHLPLHEADVYRPAVVRRRMAHITCEPYEGCTLTPEGYPASLPKYKVTPRLQNARGGRRRRTGSTRRR